MSSRDSGRRARVPFSSERQQAILRNLRRHGRVDAADLASGLAVTGETIRKDLVSLEAKGLLVRVHGGAVPVGSHSDEPDVTSRTEFAEQKHRIALAAVAHLPSAGSILVDAGSTTALLASAIPDGLELTVFTNTMPVALDLMARPELTVYPLGGRLRPTTAATVGSWTCRALEELNVDVAFLGTNGFTLERGFTTPDSAEAQVKNLMAKAAARRVMLADSSKFGRLSLVRHADLGDVDLLITDTGLADRDVQRLSEAGLAVERV